jgi:tetratricopeptide (TPR) repeat protein
MQRAQLRVARALLRDPREHNDGPRADHDQDVEIKFGDSELWRQCWSDVASDYSNAIESSPLSYSAHPGLALIRLAHGDQAGYQACCLAMLDQFAHSTDKATLQYTGWTCAFAPGGLNDHALPIEIAERAMKLEPGSQKSLQILGAVFFRTGQFQEALDRLTESTKTVPDPSWSAAYSWYFLAMAHHKLGHTDDANECFGNANRL